jgi:hypothetical protein
MNLTHKPRQTLGPVSSAMLRILADEGAKTRNALTERMLCCSLPITAAQVSSSINSLTSRGAVVIDQRTKPSLIQITQLGRRRLQGKPDADTTSTTHFRASLMHQPPYQPSKNEPPCRPGALDAYALPSRMGDDLHHLPLHARN